MFGVKKLIGKTIVKIEQLDEGGNQATVESKHVTQLIFHTDTEKYRMFHLQDCCESVWLEDVVGDFEDLIGTPIVMAEEILSCRDETAGGPGIEGSFESWTWTFYNLSTAKGTFTLRWFGTSNGYCGESVDFDRMK